MRSTTKAALAALTLTLTLSVLEIVQPGAAQAHDGEDHSSDTTVAGGDEPADVVVPADEPLSDETVAPPTTAPAETTTTAPAAPSTTAAPEQTPTATTRARHPAWRYYRCGSGITACHLAKHHQRHGHYRWFSGLGTRGHTWTRYKREARQLRIYLAYMAEAQRRQSLVNRWSGVARCESGGRWGISTGNGYYGGLQFNLRTWRAYGGSGYPHHQPAWYQARIADRVRTQSGLHHWPHCGRYYG